MGKSIEDSIREAVTASLNEEGWADSSKVSALLKEKGIKYSQLYLFLNVIRDSVETRNDDSTTPPTRYIRLLFTDSSRIINLKPRDALKDWALLVRYNKNYPKYNFQNLAIDLHKTMYELWEKVLKGEKWNYEDTKNPTNFPILESYLQYTFYRLRKEDEHSEGNKKIIELDNYAAFNTGLVDKRYRPIYAIFTKNPSIAQTWQLLDYW